MIDEDKKLKNNAEEEDDDEGDESRSIESEEKEAAEEAAKQDKKSESLFDKIKKVIFPLSNQQRNLARETGGVEENKKEGKYTSKDAWDGRSEEVDKMGSTDTFNSTGVRSFVFQQKRKRQTLKKVMKGIAQDALTAAEIKAVQSKLKKSGIKVSESEVVSGANQGFAKRVQNLRQDHSNSQGGGMMR